jgi:hypothetical protein
MPSRKRTWGEVALLAAGLTTGAASAEPGAFASSPAGTRVRAGDVVPVSWSLSAAETAERDEMELVLSLDDGATFPIRVVARLTPADSRVSWRVPALPTAHARLALRAGEDAAVDTEEIVAVSGAFAITASRFESLERLYAVADEWRTRDALEGAPARVAADRLASQENTPEVASRDRRTSEPETAPLVDATPADGAEGLPVPTAFTGRPPRPPFLAPRAPLPLRL